MLYGSPDTEIVLPNIIARGCKKLRVEVCLDHTDRCGCCRSQKLPKDLRGPLDALVSQLLHIQSRFIQPHQACPTIYLYGLARFISNACKANENDVDMAGGTLLESSGEEFTLMEVRRNCVDTTISGNEP